MHITSSPHRLAGKFSHYGKGDGFHSRKTATGEIHDMDAMTAAHGSLPFHTVVRVYAVSPTGIKKDSIVLRINDRGPYEPVIKDEENKNVITPHYERIVDISSGAYTQLFKNISQQVSLREQDDYTISIEIISYHESREEAEQEMRNISGVSKDSVLVALQDTLN